jgi:hypothetical protein
MRIARLESRQGSNPQHEALARPALFRWLPAVALVAVVARALAPAAQANVGETIILRCTHNESVSGFSQRAYNQALKELNADLEEYSPSCASLIREAQRAAAAGGRGGSGGGGLSTAAPVAVAATPSEQRALTHAVHAHPESVKLGSGEINPGVVHVNVASALSSLPTPLLATLAFILAGLVLVAGGSLRKRVRAGRSD